MIRFLYGAYALVVVVVATAFSYPSGDRSTGMRSGSGYSSGGGSSGAGGYGGGSSNSGGGRHK
jgi:hypothetical protein